MVKEILKAKCTSCGKEVFSLYEGQLNQNMQQHEASCELRKLELEKMEKEEKK